MDAVPNYYFNGSISRETLNNYLARAVTHTGVGQDCFSPSRTIDDDLRMFVNGRRIWFALLRRNMPAGIMYCLMRIPMGSKWMGLCCLITTRGRCG
ncbi:hypothetical protein FACS1894184_02300 [Clostridia bacterium]|nr:hypothetical protein FACS1894184_02300 [Clostridia bacterium]